MWRAVAHSAWKVVLSEVVPVLFHRVQHSVLKDLKGRVSRLLPGALWLVRRVVWEFVVLCLPWRVSQLLRMLVQAIARVVMLVVFLRRISSRFVHLIHWRNDVIGTCFIGVGIGTGVVILDTAWS